jgi:UDP-N-acetylmuramoyl-tripeptide--D-alanyl-D-alanine ligase
MIFLINILWLFRTTKFVLFWIYLWQLKEYHTGRFTDHFRTHKGKKSLFSFVQIFKFLLLFFCLVDPSLTVLLLPALFFIYLVETGFFLVSAFKGTVKKPKITFKTFILISFSFIVVILFLFWTTQLMLNESKLIFLLVFDVFLVFIISAVVLLIQPFFVLARNIILIKAKNKLEQIKLLSGLKVVAITGSYGKTSTKEFLTTILSSKFKVLSTEKHQNSEVGIATRILKDLKPSHKIFVAEVGAYNKGKVKEVCKILRPDIGIVTGVNEQHLSLFGSLKNLLSAEGGEELAESLPKNGHLIVNGNNKYCLELLKKSDNLPENQEKIYSTNNYKTNADIWSEDIFVKKDSVSFIATDKNKNMANFEVKVLGKHNVENLLGAILTASILGMSFEEIVEACKKINQEQSGMVLKQGKLGVNIIDSSYSANPTGVLADLDYLSIFSGKKAIIMPCLIELGGKSSETHYNLGKKIGEICDLAIITSKDKFKEIKKGAMEKGMKEKNILLCDNSNEIYSAITLFCKAGDTVLLEGRVPNKLTNLFKR